LTGGFDLAAEWMGWENVFHCEWNKFGQQVLKYYWPKAISYEDITKTDFTIHRGSIDIITGGFPCQPYSSAGKRLGKEDERHLWPEMLRAIREIQPSWVVGENVRGLTNWNGGLVFDEVQADLEAEGYEVLPFLLPACAVNAPHRRDRIWFVAHSTRSSKRTNELRGLRPENGEIEREGSQTIYNAIRSDGFEGNVTNTKSFDNRGEFRNLAKENGQENREWVENNTTKSTHISNEGNASNTNGNGLNERNGNNEVNTSEGRINALSHINQSNGDGNVADTRGSGLQTNNTLRKPKGEINSTWYDGEDVSSNTNVIGLRRESDGFGESRLISKESEGNYWQNFPTVSPICIGDDGLSNRLDSITFSKWRQESIKAGGNAIVPQVVHQIFKAIEEYERITTPNTD
jgi:DNA (cytosine-5)-methyltransferase 1